MTSGYISLNTLMRIIYGVARGREYEAAERASLFKVRPKHRLKVLFLLILFCEQSMVLKEEGKVVRGRRTSQV